MVQMVIKKEVKVGDKLRRIKGEHGGMEVGDVGTIENINGDDTDFINFKEYGEGHTGANLIKLDNKLEKLKKKLMGGSDGN